MIDTWDHGDGMTVILQLKINYLFIMKGEFKKGFSLLKLYRNDGGMR